VEVLFFIGGLVFVGWLIWVARYMRRAAPLERLRQEKWMTGAAVERILTP